MKTENFSKTERQALKRKLMKYGAITQCSGETGIHRTTLSRILRTGEATGEIIRKLRRYLAGESRVFME